MDQNTLTQARKTVAEWVQNPHINIALVSCFSNCNPPNNLIDPLPCLRKIKQCLGEEWRASMKHGLSCFSSQREFFKQMSLFLARA